MVGTTLDMNFKKTNSALARKQFLNRVSDNFLLICATLSNTMQSNNEA